MRKTSYLNAVLTVIAVLLGLNLLVKVADSGWPASAVAQPSGKETQLTPPFNSAEDRRVLISQLETINTRLIGIEAKLDKGLNVVVTKMPPVVVANEKKDSDRREPNSDTKIEVKREPQK